MQQEGERVRRREYEVSELQIVIYCKYRGLSFRFYVGRYFVVVVDAIPDSQISLLKMDHIPCNIAAIKIALQTFRCLSLFSGCWLSYVPSMCFSCYCWLWPNIKSFFVGCQLAAGWWYTHSQFTYTTFHTMHAWNEHKLLFQM